MAELTIEPLHERFGARIHGLDVTVGLETLLLLGVDDGEAADRVRRATRVGRHR